MLRLLLPIALFCALFPSISAAQDPREQYRTIALEGQEAFNAGDYAGAQTRWERAAEILPNPRIYRLLGRAAAALGDHVKAVRMFRLALSVGENGNPLTPEHRTEVEGTLLPEALQHVGEVRLELEPAGASVAVDGSPAELEDGALLLATGTHTLRVSHEGYATDERSIDVTAGSRDPLRIELAREGGADDAPPPAPSSGPDLAGPLALLGVGAAGLLTFAIAGGVALGENDRLADECGSRADGTCTDEQLSDLHTMTAVADAGWVIGLVAAAAGAAWLVVALTSSAPSREQALTVAPFATADAGGLFVRGAL
jgi:hypothetical protein